MSGDVAVIEGGEENDFAEVLESAGAAEFVEEGFAWVLGLLHGELVEARLKIIFSRRFLDISLG